MCRMSQAAQSPGGGNECWLLKWVALRKSRRNSEERVKRFVSLDWLIPFWFGLDQFELLLSDWTQFPTDSAGRGRSGLFWTDFLPFELTAHPSHQQKTFKVKTLGEGYNLAIFIKIKSTYTLRPSNSTPGICITEMKTQAWKDLSTKNCCWQHCSW